MLFKKTISFTVARDDLTRVIDRFVRDIQMEISASRAKGYYVVSIHCDSQKTKYYLNSLMELVRYGSGVHNINIY